jgi:hypothetical protein
MNCQDAFKTDHRQAHSWIRRPRARMRVKQFKNKKSKLRRPQTQHVMEGTISQTLDEICSIKLKRMPGRGRAKFTTQSCLAEAKWGVLDRTPGRGRTQAIKTPTMKKMNAHGNTFAHCANKTKTHCCK